MKFIISGIYSMIFIMNYVQAQQEDMLNQLADSLYIASVQEKSGPDKVLHAEPLYIDLIRDLGARKGEKEWNIGMGMTDKLHVDKYEALVEYEFAPIDRLGLEIEVPFTFYSRNKFLQEASPSNRIESLKLAAQWSFLVSQKYNTTLALGYIHEFECTDLDKIKSSTLFKGNVFNPFFIAAKRWGNNFHTLIYTGPVIEQAFSTNLTHTHYEVNTNFHYMISGTRNFLGVEVNKQLDNENAFVVLRPQMRLEVTSQIMIGIVAGIPVNKENERLSSFLRIIYEPSHK